jgi:predicted acyltransferase
VHAGPARLLAVDVLRGLVLFLLLFDGAVPAWSQRLLSDTQIGAFLAWQFSHTPWEGWTFWDFGQPGFMFLSGIAMPFAIAARRHRGLGWLAILTGALRRSAILIGLGLCIALSWGSVSFSREVLIQIGLATPFAYLIVMRPVRAQIGMCAAILAGYWLLFVVYPVDGSGASGFFAHWSQHSNVAFTFDRWFLNLFPRSQPFVVDPRGLATLNFIPSIVTIVIGALAGQVLLGSLTSQQKCRRLWLTGIGCFAGGLVLGQTVCPIIKPIYTPSWTILSAGVALLCVAGMYWLVEMRDYRRWTHPFVVLGVNPLTVYMSTMMVAPWIGKLLDAYSPVRSYTAELFVVVGMIWGLAAWLSRRRLIMTA